MSWAVHEGRLDDVGCRWDKKRVFNQGWTRRGSEGKNNRKLAPLENRVGAGKVPPSNGGGGGWLTRGGGTTLITPQGTTYMLVKKQLTIILRKKKSKVKTCATPEERGEWGG